MAFVSLLSWHYSVSNVLFDAEFLVRKHHRPLLQRETTGATSNELFQEIPAGKEHWPGPSNPFKAYFPSWELLINVPRNAFLIYPPCPWHLS